jgi:hypothetical protein
MQCDSGLETVLWAAIYRGLLEQFQNLALDEVPDKLLSQEKKAVRELHPCKWARSLAASSWLPLMPNKSQRAKVVSLTLIVAEWTVQPPFIYNEPALS